MSNETALIIDSEIKSLIDGGHKRATQMLTENVDSSIAWRARCSTMRR